MPASRTKPGQYKYAPNSTSQLLTHPIHPPKTQREILFGRTSGRGNQSSISERSSYAERNTLTESSRGQGQGNRTPHQASVTARDRNPRKRTISITEASSRRKRIRASKASDDDNITATRKRSSDSESNLPRKRVKQHLPAKNIHFPAEIMFGILDCCSDGTLLNFARTSKAYNTIIQPIMIKRALETPYNEDFGEKYPLLDNHERRCPLICALFNKNDRLLCTGLKMTPLHWAIECQEYREQQYTGAIKKLLGIAFSPNIRNYKGYAPLHTLMHHMPEGRRELKMWHCAIIDMLMEHGADVNLETETFSTELTPLLVAGLCNQHQGIIRALLKHGANWEYYRDVYGYEEGYIMIIIIEYRRLVNREMGSRF